MSNDPFKEEFIEGREVSETPEMFEEDWDDALIEGKGGTSEAKTLRPVFNYQKFRWVSITLMIVFVILAGRLFHMQVIAGDEYKEASADNRFRIQVKNPERGVIFDSEGKKLISNIPSFDLILTPADLPEEDMKKEELFAKLKKYLELSDEEYDLLIEEAGKNTYSEAIIKKDIERDLALYITPKLNDYPGFEIRLNSVRQYEDASNFAHLIGYTGRINEEEMKEYEGVYQLNDWLGKNGLEYLYEETLRGQVGKQRVEVDSNGKVKEIVAVSSPEPGKDVKLSINADLQKKVGEILYQGAINSGSRRAVALVMNPKNGEMLSIVSLPSFDNNLFARGISDDDYSRLINDEDKPLFDRVMRGTYPPGSTIKPVVGIAALEEGVVDEYTIIEDKGSIDVPNKYNPDIVYHFVGWDLSGLGSMNLYSAIAKSSDIYFYVVSGGFENREGLGVNKLGEYYSMFNLGSRTGIDLPGEKEGLIPTPEWKKKTKGEEWYLGDTYHMGIGQGDVLTTPLQVAQWTATIANGGTLYQPRVVSEIINGNGDREEISPIIKNDEFVSHNSINLVKRAMRETVLDGSGRALQYLPFSSAGKTGTAQHSGSERNHAWYTAFAPYENPEIVVTVLVEEGGDGNETAVPIVGQIMDWYFANN